MPEKIKYLCAVVERSAGDFVVVPPEQVIRQGSLDIIGYKSQLAFLRAAESTPQYPTQDYILVRGNKAETEEGFRDGVEGVVNKLVAASPGKPVYLSRVEGELKSKSYPIVKRVIRVGQEPEIADEVDAWGMLVAMLPYLITKKKNVSQ